MNSCKYIIQITVELHFFLFTLQVRTGSPSSSAFLYTSDPLGSPPPAHMGGIPYSLDPSKGNIILYYFYLFIRGINVFIILQEFSNAVCTSHFDYVCLLYAHHVFSVVQTVQICQEFRSTTLKSHHNRRYKSPV